MGKNQNECDNSWKGWGKGTQGATKHKHKSDWNLLKILQWFSTTFRIKFRILQYGIRSFKIWSTGPVLTLPALCLSSTLSLVRLNKLQFTHRILSFHIILQPLSFCFFLSQDSACSASKNSSWLQPTRCFRLLMHPPQHILGFPYHRTYYAVLRNCERLCSSAVLPPRLAEADRSCSRIPSANTISSTQQVL